MTGALYSLSIAPVIMRLAETLVKTSLLLLTSKSERVQRMRIPAVDLVPV